VFKHTPNILNGEKMDIFLLVLRLVHVFAGALWIGGALMMNFFVGSSIRATTQAEEQFADYLKAGTRLSTPLTVSAILTILAGGILYWRNSQGFTSLWMSAGPGIGYGIGAVSALAGFVFGIMLGQLNKKIIWIRGEIKGGKPTPEQLAQLRKIQNQFKVISPINASSLIIAVVFMSIARYMVF
jgi:uncharacterized membrane protein